MKRNINFVLTVMNFALFLILRRKKIELNDNLIERKAGLTAYQILT